MVKNIASKTIKIQEETYLRLIQLKQENEILDDLIQRLTFQKQDISPFFGFFTEKEGDEIEKAI